MRREEAGSARWSLYSEAAGRWLDVVFATQREAEEAASVIRNVSGAFRARRRMD